MGNGWVQAFFHLWDQQCSGWTSIECIMYCADVLCIFTMALERSSCRSFILQILGIMLVILFRHLFYFVPFIYTVVILGKFSLVIYLIYPEAESKLLSTYISLLHHSQHKVHHSFVQSRITKEDLCDHAWEYRFTIVSFILVKLPPFFFSFYGLIWHCIFKFFLWLLLYSWLC